MASSTIKNTELLYVDKEVEVTISANGSANIEGAYNYWGLPLSPFKLVSVVALGNEYRVLPSAVNDNNGYVRVRFENFSSEAFTSRAVTVRMFYIKY